MLEKGKKRIALIFISAFLVLTGGCSTQEISGIKEDILATAEDVSETEDTKIVTISEGKYAYSCLDEETKRVYDEILYVILKHQESIRVSTLDTGVLEAAYHAVNADYGGLFWVSGYQYTQYMLGEVSTGLSFSPQYTMDYEERQKMQAQIDMSVEQILSGISITDSDYDKAKYVYETLIQNVDYVPEAENNQNIISVFIGRQTVCQGYACATQYLLNLLDVPGVIVTGTANGETHAWNMVLLDGNYYYMDTTWGDPAYANTENREEKEVNYDYLNLTTAELTRTHTVITDFSLPECTAFEDNYYVREGYYYTDWYPEEIGALYRVAWENGSGFVTVKFADAALYEQAKNYYITEQHLADFCDGLKAFQYRENTDLNILTIYFR